MTLPSTPLRERVCLDKDWLFSFGHPHDYRRDHFHGASYFSHIAKAGYGDGPAASDFDDRTWRRLDLPHDWAVELPFSKKAGHSHGYKTLGRDCPEHSVGWYRRRFEVSEAELGRRFELAFDGVFRAAQVFVNGFYLGCEPSGHTSFHYDITDYLNYGGVNVIAVRVDASLEEGWYYEGAGIYRHVWLTKTNPLRVGHDGIFITTELSDRQAELTIRIEIECHASQARGYALIHRIIDAADCLVAECHEDGMGIAAGSTVELTSRVVLADPELWSLETPRLYRLETTVYVADEPVDSVEVRFGIRSAVFDPERGFLLNGRRVQLKGTNNHQDHAGLGTALPDALQEYRLRRLKSFGCNAYRCSHHPPAPELLDACDRLGILVIDENRSMGVTPVQLGELERMIRRDRNHPSVILWSLGNEEWAIEGNVRGARIAATMQRRAQQLDPTRRVTVAISGGWGQGISAVIDVMGYNYISHGSTDEQHARFPLQPGVGTEETTTQCTRGVYFSEPERAHSAPVMDGTSGGNTEIGWKHYAERPYLAGLFYWTGFDYRGESNPFEFPAISSQFGILDTCGFDKDWAHYLRAWWSSEPVLHVMPHWNWSGREGEPMRVCVFSNADEVELLLNGVSLGTQTVERNGHLEWTVPYAPGKLEARGRSADGSTLIRSVETTGPAAGLELEVDRPRILADGCDAAVITVRAVDAAARAVPTADQTIHFKIEGAGRIIGVGNGDPSSLEADCSSESVELIELTAMRSRVIGDASASAEIEPDFDDSSWPSLLDAKEGSREPSTARVIRGILELSATPNVDRAKLLMRWFGERQQVYLNGRSVAAFSRHDYNGLPQVDVSSEQLRVGKNVIAIVASAYRDAARREQDERVRQAVLRIDRPAPEWRRRLFNGLAQVIVQSNGIAGKLVLEASAPGLALARASVIAKCA